MVTINDVEYTEDQLDDSQKYLVAQIKDLEQKLAMLNFEADQINVAKKSFTDILVQSLQESDDE